MRHRFIFALLLPLALAAAAFAQDKPSVAVGTARRDLRIKIDLINSLPVSEVRKLQDIRNYEVIEVKSSHDLAAAFASEVNRIRTIADPATRATELDNLAASLAASPPNLVDASTQPDCSANCTRVTVQLASPIDYDKTYQLRLVGVTLDGTTPAPPVEFKIGQTADIQPALNASDLRKEVRIQSAGPLANPATPPALSAPITIERKTLRINPSGTAVVENFDRISATATKPDDDTPNLIEVRLGKRLNEAQSHTLLVRTGLTDGTGVPLQAKGTVKIPGMPSPPTDPELSLKIATSAAVAQKPQFDLAVNWAPYKKNSFGLSPGWWWQPGAAIDVGLGNTKSNNSIVLSSLFLFSSNPSSLRKLPPARPTLGGSPVPAGVTDDIQLKTYQKWLRTPWYQLGNYDFFIGPKLEADRVFRRINAVGNARFDFRFHRWVATVKDKRKLLVPELHDLADLVEINHGFRIVPYVSFDFGGNVKNETVENKKKKVSISVPRHEIFRAYVGSTALFEWRLFSFPMTLSIDESAMYLAAREEIGFVTDAGVGLRRVHGLQHHGKASWDIALDPAKHFNFNVTYENGRTAPNFEYLNKTTTGFKVIF